MMRMDASREYIGYLCQYKGHLLLKNGEVTYILSLTMSKIHFLNRQIVFGDLYRHI